MSDKEQCNIECTQSGKTQEPVTCHQNKLTESPEERTTKQNILFLIYACQVCNKQYQSKASLRYHAFKHATNVQFTCDVADCGKSFKNPKLLSAHKCAYHKSSSPQFVCEYCGYNTRARGNLQVHRRIHTGIKPYCCETCGKRFVALYQLRTHYATHTAQRRHKCNVCGVAFTSAKTLSHHKALHLDQKKYKCKCCGKRYAQAAGMSQHMRMHRERNECKIVTGKVTGDKLTECLNELTEQKFTL